MATIGATSVPAHAALKASAPNRRPRFFVFNLLSVDSGSCGADCLTGGFMAAMTAVAGAITTAGVGANLSRALSSLWVFIARGATSSWSDVVGSVNPSASSRPQQSQLDDAKETGQLC